MTKRTKQVRVKAWAKIENGEIKYYNFDLMQYHVFKKYGHGYIPVLITFSAPAKEINL